MPTYEYACKSCGERFEVVQSFSDDPLTTCEACGEPLRKVFGSVGVVLKGSGFYRTDNRVGPRKDSTRTEAKAGTGSTESASGGDSGKDSGKGSDSGKDSKSTSTAKGDSKVASGAASANKPA